MIRDRLRPGAPLSQADVDGPNPPAQALLVTYAPNAPEIVGSLLPLQRESLSIGRGDDQDLRLRDASVSMAHAVLRRPKESELTPPARLSSLSQRGAWILVDAGSEGGTYSSYARERESQVTLLHGSEAQIGECRVTLDLPSISLGISS
jgi:serine/threonine-protein kinase